MIDVERTRKLLSLIAAAGFLWLPASAVGADIMSECREEASLYGIPPEQFDDYIDGCVLSRGGGYAPAETGETTAVLAHGENEALDASADAEATEALEQTLPAVEFV